MVNLALKVGLKGHTLHRHVIPMYSTKQPPYQACATRPTLRSLVVKCSEDEVLSTLSVC